jgi:hypothetical protein
MTASNTVTTVDQVRQDFQHSATVEGLMKNVYLPALNNTVFHATPLMEMFGDFGGKLKFEGNKVIKAFKYQGAGGFGGISEGGDFVKGRDQKGFQGYERLKYLNAFVSLTGPAAKTVMSGSGAYVDALSSSMEDTLKWARQNMERILGGAGTGELCRFALPDAVNEAAMAAGEYVRITAGATDTTPVSITASAGGAYTKVQWLQPGIRVNLIPDGNFDGDVTTAEHVIDSSSARAVFEVTNVDRAAGTFALKLVSTTGTVNLETFDNDTLVVVLENAYGEIEDDGDVASDYCLEPNGLMNLIDDGDTYSTIWNRTRSSYPHSLKSVVEAAGSVEIDEELLMGWLLDLVNITQSVPDVLVTDPKSRLKYFSNQKDDRRFNTQVIDGPFGMRSMGITIDQYTLMLQSLASLLPGTLLMIVAKAFSFINSTDGFEWRRLGGEVWRPYESKDGMFATALSYTNFVCEDPRGQFKATGLSY